MTSEPAPRRDKASSARPLFDAPIVKRAAIESFGKLDPRRMIKNPVMFVVEIGSAFTTLLFIHALATGDGDAPAGFIAAVSAWLWFTVLFANFAEAMAEFAQGASRGSRAPARRAEPRRRADRDSVVSARAG